MGIFAQRTRSYLSHLTLATMSSLAPLASSPSDYNPSRSSSLKTHLTFQHALNSDSISTISTAKEAQNNASFPLLKTSYTHCYPDKYAAIVTDAVTGDVLYGFNHHAPRYPASLTKLMTAFLTCEALAQNKISLSDTLRPTKSKDDYKTKFDLVVLGLDSLEYLTVKQAFDAMMVVSAADATDMLATHIAGDADRFVTHMNERAAQLGMTQTHFTNTTGAPDKNQISTAADMAILLRALMQYYPDHMHILNQKSMVFRGRTYKNYSALPDTDFGKTGFIDDSRYNIAVSGTHRERRTITVLYGAKNNTARARHVKQLQDFVSNRDTLHSAYADSLLNHHTSFALMPKRLYRFDLERYQLSSVEMIKPRGTPSIPHRLRTHNRLTSPATPLYAQH